jgi:acetylornithine deacetylase/succinyl-diaminopimelate desuccinylase-like protein
MEQGHKSDEFIHVSQLEFCEEFMTRLCDELSG